MKKMSTIILLIALSFLIAGCNSIKIPDLVGLEESHATDALKNNGFLVQIQKEYDDKVPKGSVMKTDPLSGVPVDKESKVVLYISKGPKMIQSKSSVLSWYSVYGSNGDNWEFENPRIEEENLVMRMRPEINSKYEISWDEYGSSTLKDGSNKSFPVKFTKTLDYYVLEIPLGDLEDKRVTSIDIILYYKIDGKQRSTDFSLVISW